MALGSQALGSQVIHFCGECVDLNVMLTSFATEGHMLNSGVLSQREKRFVAVRATVPALAFNFFNHLYASTV